MPVWRRSSTTMSHSASNGSTRRSDAIDPNERPSYCLSAGFVTSATSRRGPVGVRAVADACTPSIIMRRTDGSASYFQLLRVGALCITSRQLGSVS